MVRDQLIPVRVNTEEYRLLAVAARAAASRGISTYMRDQCLFAVKNGANHLTSAKQRMLRQKSWEIARITSSLLSVAAEDAPSDFQIVLVEIRNGLEKIIKYSIELENIATTFSRNR